MSDDTMRAMLAEVVALGLQQHFPNAEVVKTVNTSECPVIRLKLASGDRFNLTITRARK